MTCTVTVLNNGGLYKPVSGCMHEWVDERSIFTDLASSFVGSANLVSHLCKHGHQAGFVLQLLPQCPATAVPQGSLNLTVPTLVVGVIVGILQQPASTENID